MAGVVDGLVQPPAHPARRADDAVHPGHVDHLDDGAHAAPLLPDAPGDRAVVLDLGGGVGAVAELVLEPLQVHAVALPAGQDARQEEAGEPSRGLRQDEEDVAHRRRAEPLVAGQAVGPVARGLGAGGVGPHVGAALLLGHRHPTDEAAFFLRGPEAELVLGGGEEGLEASGELRLGAQDRDGGVGHRHGAAVALLGLRRPDQVLRRAHEVGVGGGVAPRPSRETERDRRAHELVPRRVVLDLVDAVAVAVVGVEDRRVLARQAHKLLDAGRSDEPAQLAHLRLRFSCTLAAQRLEQRRVVGGVVVDEGWDLVEDLVRLAHPHPAGISSPRT